VRKDETEVRELSCEAFLTHISPLSNSKAAALRKARPVDRFVQRHEQLALTYKLCEVSLDGSVLAVVFKKFNNDMHIIHFQWRRRILDLFIIQGKAENRVVMCKTSVQLLTPDSGLNEESMFVRVRRGLRAFIRSRPYKGEGDSL
jgi:hypothetical protein